MAECLHTTQQLQRCTVSQGGQFNLRSHQCPSLTELCVYHIVKMPLAIMIHYFDKLESSAALNNCIAQMIMHYLDSHTLEYLIKTGSFLSDPVKCQITELCLTKRPFEDIAIKHMHCHNLSALYLAETDISDDALTYISTTQPHLTHLDISYCLRLEVFDKIFNMTKLQYLDLTRTHFKLSIINSFHMGRIPIKWLGLAYLQKHHSEDPLKLQHLISCGGTLQGLSLCGTAWDIDNSESLLRFPNLEHLDVSFYPSHEQDLYYDTAVTTFCVMPSLKSLDLSGCTFHEDEVIMRLQCLNLEFLGIVLPHLLLDNVDMLAKKVASNRKLEHLLVQLQRYITRPDMLETALKNLFHLHRERNVQGYDTSNLNPLLFDAVLHVLEMYPQSRDIQMIAVACMHPLTNTQLTYNGIGSHIRRGILVFLKNLKNFYNFEVLRNTLSLLSNFNLREPDYMFYDIMKALLEVLNRTNLNDNDQNMQRHNRQLCKLNVKIINACICKASSHKKSVCGEMGLVESILNAAAEAFKLFLRVVDIEVILLLEECWSTLWNITDELPVNCDRFITHGGLEFYYQTYLHCSNVLETIGEDGSTRITTIIRNMLGLMGNIAEVAHIRPSLITQDLIQSYLMLLNYEGEAENPSDIVEIRYSAAGILSHICSDGEHGWDISDPSFTKAAEGIEAAVSTWNLDSERTINYKSFHPILRLIEVDCVYECKHWALWALANLCHYQPLRFVPMLRRDGGEVLIRPLIHQLACPSNVRVLALFLLERLEDTNIPNVIQSIDQNSEGDS